VTAPVASTSSRAPFGIRRSSEDRMVAGICGGIAATTGIASVYVRAGFVVLSLVWGLGAILYIAAWATTIDLATVEESDEVLPQPASRQAHLGAGAILLSALIVLRGIGIWPGDGMFWPAAAIVVGAAFLLDQRGIDSRDFLSSLVDPGDSSTRRRSIVGIVLLVVGLAMFGSSAVPQIGTTVLAVAVTGIGLTLLFGPWMWRLAKDLGDERSERVRQEERAEMAAHLHDSVLQTLTLIQRTEDPKRMVTLARHQERELRRWLYDRAPNAGTGSLSVLLQTTVDRLEADFDVPVDLVIAGGDVEDDFVVPLAAATGEAIANAAKHSGAAKISVYVEVSPEAVDIWVADQGSGFDLSEVGEDRRGISDSIVGRIRRHGGTAEVVSEPGEGTEVHLHMERVSSE
ncbi:MAG: PspC domain-containing protein, partial [Acidimicrobiia bacterium]|nr:PspC domain-containing protein [Acidimicrobiia bacterium]